MSLNCESTQIKIMDRGGVTPIFDVPEFEVLEYNRLRDDISQCDFTAYATDADCAANYALLEAGRHEVLIVRNGVRVWEGPVTRAAFKAGQLKVNAHDVWHYVYRTIMRSAYNNAYPSIDFATERVRTILETELTRGWEAVTPPIGVLPYLDIRTNEETAQTTRNTVEYEKTAWEEIDDMAAHSGIDYTAVGRRMLVFDTHDIIGRTVQLTDRDFDGEIIMTQYGMDLCTYSAVTDGMGNWSATLVDEDYYGPWEMLETSYSVQDTIQCDAVGAETAALAEMHEQTVRNLNNRYPTPVVIRVPDNSRLNPDCGLTMDDLVPGIRIPLLSTQTGRTLAQEQKLDSVKFTLEGGDEVITVVLSPAPTGASFNEAGSGDSGVPPGDASPSSFLVRSGAAITLDGQPWRATGVNLPWSMGCGSGAGLVPTLAQHATMFAAAKPNSIYRIFVFGGTNLATFDAIIAAARPYGHRFIVTLSDAQNGCGEPYCGPNPTAFVNGGWITGGWRDNWLTVVVNRYKTEPLIGMWEWVNELNKSGVSTDAGLRTFLDDVGAYVRTTLGDTHLICTGNQSQFGAQARARLMNASPYIDVCSMHEYDPTQAPSNWTDEDAADAAAYGKPFIVGESGILPSAYASGTARANQIKAKIDALHTSWPTCAAYIYWSGAAPGFSDPSTRYEISINSTPEINVINTEPF